MSASKEDSQNPSVGEYDGGMEEEVKRSVGDEEMRSHNSVDAGDEIGAPRAYHGLEEHNRANGDHGKDDQGVQGSLEEQGRDGIAPKTSMDGGIAPKMPLERGIAPKMLFDPLVMPLAPMTRARAKRFKEALLGFVRSHLEGLKSIEDQLESIEDIRPRNIPIDFKLCTILAIDDH